MSEDAGAKEQKDVRVSGYQDGFTIYDLLFTNSAAASA